jgi:hypothetical protein
VPLVPTEGTALPPTSPLAPHLAPDAAAFGVPPPPSAPPDTRAAWVRKRTAGVPVSMLDFSYLAP